MKRIMKIIGGLILFICAIIVSINLYVYFSTKPQFEKDITDADCILVLGAGIRNNQPTPMLKDRLDEAKKLYDDKKAPYILVSGDNGSEYYNEVAVMRQYLIDNGVPADAIYMDHAGFSTYESVYRARDIFLVKKMIIVTQDYHLYRALYIANALGVEAVGYPSNPRTYSNQISRDIREVVARCKDFVTCIYQPEPTYLGETIPLV